jgi:hypothetical protein
MIELVSASETVCNGSGGASTEWTHMRKYSSTESKSTEQYYDICMRSDWRILIFNKFILKDVWFYTLAKTTVRQLQNNLPFSATMLSRVCSKKLAIIKSNHLALINKLSLSTSATWPQLTQNASFFYYFLYSLVKITSRHLLCFSDLLSQSNQQTTKDAGKFPRRIFVNYVYNALYLHMAVLLTHTRNRLDKQNDSKNVGSCSCTVGLNFLRSARLIDATLWLQNFTRREMKNVVLSD